MDAILLTAHGSTGPVKQTYPKRLIWDRKRSRELGNAILLIFRTSGLFVWDPESSPELGKALKNPETLFC
jgi:hypothetical protein